MPLNRKPVEDVESVEPEVRVRDWTTEEEEDGENE